MLPSSRLLAAARYLAGVTQRELAREADVAVSSLRKAEIGSVGVRARTVEKLMRALAAHDISFILDHEHGREGLMHAAPPTRDGGKPVPPASGGKLKRVGRVGTAKRPREIES